jgi:hypothetical protein
VVTPLGLPSDQRISFEPFDQVHPAMPIAGLFLPTTIPGEEAERLRRISLAAKLIDIVNHLAPARTPPVPGSHEPFLAAVYPTLMHRAWPTPPAVPPGLLQESGGPLLDFFAELAVDGPFGSYLRAATIEESQRVPGSHYVIDLDWMLAFPTRPDLLAPGGTIHFAVDNGALRTVGLCRAGSPVPMAPWRGRQIECDAMLAAMNEDLTTFRHNVFVHLATLTPFALASSNRLPADHPVRRLLHHCFHTVLIGNRELAQLQLGGPAGFAATIFSHDHVDVARMATRRLTGYDFWDLEPDVQFSRRGTTTTEFPYPYRDNILELWDVTLAYVRQYLALYYADDASVMSDPHLLDWFDDLDQLLPNGLGARPPSLADWIARICATLIHVSTVEHDFLNNVTWDYSTLGWLLPTVAPSNGERMDQRRAFDLISTLIVTWKPYNMLLSADIPELALDTEARTVMETWLANLQRIQDTMAARGRRPSLSYPANLNVSISN